MASKIPSGVWLLGLVSMLMDVSSEMIHSLLPLFMIGPLGASVFMVGLVEGLGESTALIVKVFSGTWSDRLGKRKMLAVFGYGMAAATKPLFAVAPVAGVVLVARLLDRIGKGMRGAPRDALITDITPPDMRGAAFGLRQSLDTIGAVAGPLLAVVLMLAWANNFRAVFWVAVIPAIASVTLLWLGVREPAGASAPKPSPPLTRKAMRRMGRDFWMVVVFGAVFTLARFSEAFLVLRAQQAGMSQAMAPLVMVAMNVVYASTAYPFGKLSDNFSHHKMLALGLAVLIASDLVLAQDVGWMLVLGGVALWGVHMGLTQGLLSRMVADAAPDNMRGTAFGFFNLASGIAMLLASVLAGLLWERYGAAATFYAGASFSLLSLLALGWHARFGGMR
ncbi:MAG TPA: MFS transporter [Pseudoduganella sp.]